MFAFQFLVNAMNIYYDENMPFAKEFFGELGNLTAFSGRDLTAEQVRDADVLLVRSITQVNETLLYANNTLAFVGTATIGVDHIDQDYLATRNISFSSAPGCNAISVAEYVISALVILAERYLFDLKPLTVGIVGAGNTGTRLSEKLDALGVKYVLCDPLKAKDANDTRQFVELEEALKCDVISMHVPLTKGEHSTYHLINQDNLARLTDKQILISACRGAVIDNQALLSLKQQGHGLKVVLDVWEGEPNLLTDLIDYVEIGSAHIAGYSLEGKARGTEMLYQALCQQLKQPPIHTLSTFLPDASVSAIEVKEEFNEVLLNQIVKLVYDVRRDDAIFRQNLASHGFDTLRKTYPVRREFSALDLTMTNSAHSDILYRLGFGNTSK